MNTDLMFSSKTGMWDTPQEFYDKLDKEFHFTLDPCCTSESQKCPSGFAVDLGKDGLDLGWFGTVFMNPPYGRDVIGWVKKAYEESRRGCVVVGLLPARTDTRWFHEYIYGKAEIRFIKGRLKFGGAKNAAPFPSMVVIWREP